MHEGVIPASEPPHARPPPSAPRWRFQHANTCGHVDLPVLQQSIACDVSRTVENRDSGVS